MRKNRDKDMKAEEGIIGLRKETVAKLNLKINTLIDRLQKKLLGKVSLKTSRMPALTGASKLQALQTASAQANKIVEDELKATANLLSKNFSSQLKIFNQKQMLKVKRIISNGIATGKHINVIKEEVKEEINKWKVKRNPPDNEIERIVRTESSKAFILFHLKKWDMEGFTEVEHLIVVSGACGECRKLNRKRFKIKSLLKTGKHIPIHLNCRCEYIVYS